MRQSSLRTRITTGAFTLPTIAVVTLLLWLAVGIDRWEVWGSLAITAMTAYGVVELSNRNALLRIRSRMVSCTFLTLILACSFLHDAATSLLPMLCWVVMLFCMFATYGRSRPEGFVFYAFLSLSVGSLFSPLLLLCAPLLCFSMIQQLRILNWRTFFASFLGIVLPYWFALGYAVWTDSVNQSFVMLTEHFALPAPDYSTLTCGQIGTWIITSGLFLAAVVHYLYTAYNDKIRIRMFYYMLIIQEFVLLATLLLHPQDFTILFSVFLVNSAPLLAHHVTLSRGRWAEIWMLVCIVMIAGLTVFNYFGLWKVL